MLTGVTSGLSSDQEAEGYKPVPQSLSQLTAATFDAGDEHEGWSGTQWEKTSTKSVELESIFGNASDSFPAAGIYMFNVTENVSGGSSGDSGKWGWTSSSGQHAPETYLMRVHVINDDSGSSPGLGYDYATIERTGEGAGGKTETPTFSSQYEEKTTFAVNEQTEGAFGDKTHMFATDIYLFLPSWVQGTIAQNALEPTASDPMSSVDLRDPEQVDFDVVEDGESQALEGAKLVVYRVMLGHGGSVSFNVPVGTRYKVDQIETGYNGIDYSQTIMWNM